MDKLKMQSENLVDENVKKIASLFPNCVTESVKEYDKKGNPILHKAVDFDLLRQELSNVLVEGRDERYRLDWAGKRQAILTANSPITKTLRPVLEDEKNPTGADSTGNPYLSSGSVGKDGTPGKFDSENLYIEGDNLDVLKLLHETYLNKVKMIYIDPPYNTGNDFVYNDDFAVDSEEYLAMSNQTDEQGNRMSTNKETSGRYHSDWLSMMYMRLKLAKDLLTDDGVVLISMADNELCNLLKICEEIFGYNNIEISIWKKKGGAGNTEKIIGVLTEYVIFCFNDKKPYDLNYQTFTREYKFQDENGEYNLEGIEKTNLGTYERKTMLFPIIDPKTKLEFYPSENMRWTIGKENVEKLINDNKLYFDYDTKKVKRKKYSSDYDLSENVYYNLLMDEGSLATAKDEILSLLGNRELFDTPKPTKLLFKLLTIASKSDSIILDFFSGSATTAHAVMQLNAEDGGNRKFIMVQLPELTDEKSEAYKAGYKNICEIGKERIRRAGKSIFVDQIYHNKYGSSIPQLKDRDKPEIKSFSEEEISKVNLDIGFRVLKLADSNMKDVYYNPREYNQSMLLELDSSIKEDRTEEDILFQIMLDKGISLSSKIEKREFNELGVRSEELGIKDKNNNSSLKIHNSKLTYYIVGETGFGIIDLVCCLDKKVNTNAVKEIAKLQPECCVFLDSGIENDATRTNIQQLFTTYSPKTKVEVL